MHVSIMPKHLPAAANKKSMRPTHPQHAHSPRPREPPDIQTVPNRTASRDRGLVLPLDDKMQAKSMMQVREACKTRQCRPVRDGWKGRLRGGFPDAGKQRCVSQTLCDPQKPKETPPRRSTFSLTNLAPTPLATSTHFFFLARS